MDQFQPLWIWHRSRGYLWFLWYVASEGYDWMLWIFLFQTVACVSLMSIFSQKSWFFAYWGFSYVSFLYWWYLWSFRFLCFPFLSCFFFVFSSNLSLMNCSAAGFAQPAKERTCSACCGDCEIPWARRHFQQNFFCLLLQWQFHAIDVKNKPAVNFMLQSQHWCKNDALRSVFLLKKNYFLEMHSWPTIQHQLFFGFLFPQLFATAFSLCYRPTWQWKSWTTLQRFWTLQRFLTQFCLFIFGLWPSLAAHAPCMVEEG